MKDTAYNDVIIKIVNALEIKSRSRKELSEILGLSVSTVGGIISTLITRGIIYEFDQSNSLPGRRTKLLTLTNDPIFALVKITHDSFCVEYFSYGLKTKFTVSHQISDPLFIDDCLTALLLDISSHSPSIQGIAFVCDGNPVNNRFAGSSIIGINTLTIPEMANEHLQTDICYIENSIMSCLSDKNGLNIVLSESNYSLKLTIISDGTMITGKNSVVGNVEKLIDNSSRTIGNSIKYAKNSNEYTSAIARIVYNIICIFDPHKIIIDTDRYSSGKELVKRVTEKLMLNYKIDLQQLPTILDKCEIFDFEMIDLRRKIRNTYILKH